MGKFVVLLSLENIDTIQANIAIVEKIPFLRRILQNARSCEEKDIVEFLKRIGTPEALDAIRDHAMQ